MLTEKDMGTIRAHTQIYELMEQKFIIESIYSDMEEFWLHLYTRDKKCPIIEQVATNVKRRLVHQYTAKLIVAMRNTIGLDIVPKISDPDSSYWVADDVVARLSDNKTESHRGLFNAILVGVFGFSTNVISFMELEKPTKNDVYDMLMGLYDIDFIDPNLDDEVNKDDIIQSLNNYLSKQGPVMFEVCGY